MLYNTDILIVDDRPENLLALEALLDDIHGLNIIKAGSGNQALSLTLDYDFALILLDVQMPEMDGFETAELLRARHKTRHIPIIFVTAISKEQQHVFKGYEMGAVDYLFKPVNSNILKTKVKVFIELHKQKKELEETVSRLKKSEEKLRESGEQYRLLVENSGDAIIIIQDEFIKFHNQRTEDISGYSAQELAAIPFSDHIHPEDREMVREKYRERILKKKSEVYSFRFLNKHGEELYAEVNAIPVIWKGKPAIQGFIRDITRQRKLESHLQQVQKLEAIGTLAGGIAHDFNNILSIIMGYTEMAARTVHDASMVKQNLDQVMNASLRAKELVQQILTFSRKGEQDKKPVIINPVIRETLKMLRASLPKTIEIKEKIDSEIIMLMSNPTQIHQIMMNLCTNAAHAMEEKGGELEVCLTSDINISQYPDLQDCSYVKLTVRDTGCGIDKSMIKKIFDPYFTTKEVGKGTGMGLAVVHGIVTDHKGFISVESQPGKGTLFEILLPRLLNKKPVKKKNDILAFSHGNQRILFIDDEKLLANLGKQMLEHLGYHVESQTDPFSALDVFKKKPDWYDLVITDMTMPHMTGERLSLEMMKIRPDIPVIICTGYSEKLTEEKVRSMGIKACLMKPIVMKGLAETVYNALLTVSSEQ